MVSGIAQILGIIAGGIFVLVLIHTTVWIKEWIEDFRWNRDCERKILEHKLYMEEEPRRRHMEEEPRQSFTTYGPYVCEWCEPSDIPNLLPQICMIAECPWHGRVWFWPRYPDDSFGQKKVEKARQEVKEARKRDIPAKK